jgi:hypothetical protein
MVGIEVDDPADRQTAIVSRQSVKRSGSVRFSAEDLADEGDAEEKADEYDLEAGLEASRKSGGVAKPGHAPSKQFMAQQSMRHPQGHQGNKGKLYRQPSLMDKYRRSATFNEIMEKNLHEVRGVSCVFHVCVSCVCVCVFRVCVFRVCVCVCVCGGL